VQHRQSLALNTTFAPQSPRSRRSQRAVNAYLSPKSGMQRNQSTYHLADSVAVLTPA